jgi:hypothetical protein
VRDEWVDAAFSERHFSVFGRCLKEATGCSM